MCLALNDIREKNCFGIISGICITNLQSYLQSFWTRNNCCKTCNNYFLINKLSNRSSMSKLKIICSGGATRCQEPELVQLRRSRISSQHDRRRLRDHWRVINTHYFYLPNHTILLILLELSCKAVYTYELR